MSWRTALARVLRVARAVRLGDPPLSRVLVFDREGAEVVQRMVLGDLPHAVLAVRGEIYHASPRVLWRMARRVPAVYAAARPGELAPGLRGVAEVLWRGYLLACFDAIRPDVVVTYIDNSAAFHWVSRHVGRGTFLAIQNGSRLRPNVRDWLPRPPRAGSVISMPHLFCFSQFEPELYRAHGHDVDEFHVVGSVRGDYYRGVMAPTRRGRPTYDLCVVSEWEASLFEPGSAFAEVGASLAQLYAHLARFLALHECRTAVALRSADAREHAYFAALLGARATLIRSDRGAMSTYAAMDESRVVVALNSTAAREAFGWGRAVLFANFTGDAGHNPPRTDPLWLVEDPSYDAFAAALGRLLDLAPGEFGARSRAALPAIMHHDPARPAYAVIRAHVDASLAAEGR